MKLNLLHDEAVIYSKAARLRRANRLVLMISGTIFLVLVMIVAGQYFYYTYRNNEEKVKLKQLEADYVRRADEIVHYIRLKEILFQSQNVIATRKKYQELLAGVYGTFPEGVYVVSAEFKGFKDLLFSGKASGIGEYEAFLSKFDSESKMSGFLFKSVVQDSLTRSIDGSYKFDLSLKAK